MSSHTLRDLPTKHVQQATLRPYFGYPKNAVKGKFSFLPVTEVSYIGANGTNGHRKEHSKFERLGGETLRWGMFNRQVYCAVHPLMDGTDVLLKNGVRAGEIHARIDSLRFIGIAGPHHAHPATEVPEKSGGVC